MDRPTYGPPLILYITSKKKAKIFIEIRVFTFSSQCPKRDSITEDAMMWNKQNNISVAWFTLLDSAHFPFLYPSRIVVELVQQHYSFSDSSQNKLLCTAWIKLNRLWQSKVRTESDRNSLLLNVRRLNKEFCFQILPSDYHIPSRGFLSCP